MPRNGKKSKFDFPDTLEPGETVEHVCFWFVWTKKGKVPRFAHTTRKSARKEARRLARLNPGKKFIVLMAESKHVYEVPAVETVEADLKIAA